MMLYVVTYKGPMAFIKPYNALRDEVVHSQIFLSPGTISGIERYLFGSIISERILRHKLKYSNIALFQQETTRSPHMKIIKNKTTGFKTISTTSILRRNILVNPCLKLAFSSKRGAEIAKSMHLCLVRNEDVVLPESEIEEMSVEDFNTLDGFELLYDLDNPTEVKDGYIAAGRTRYIEGKPMCYGEFSLNI